MNWVSRLFLPLLLLQVAWCDAATTAALQPAADLPAPAADTKAAEAPFADVPEVAPEEVSEQYKGKKSLKELMLQEKQLQQDIPTIELNFENADLQSIIDYMGDLFGVSYVTDDAVKPLVQGGREATGHKISFKSHRRLNKRQVYDLFTTFLDLAGLALVPTADETVIRVAASPSSNMMSLPVFIDIDPKDLPENDEKIRYVFFLKNADIGQMQQVINQMRSSTSALSVFSPLKALILTDKAYNVKTLMSIIKELDKANQPEQLSVLRLERADAVEVKKLYDELMKSDDPRGMVSRVFGNKRTVDALVFPENTRVIAEPRSNSLIVLGTQETIKKIEDFIKQRIDVDLDDAGSPLYVYDLQHTEAESMAQILNKAYEFGRGTAAGEAGGIRAGQRFTKQITFTPERSGNRLIIKADYEDYLQALEVIKKLDIMQPQVAIEVLVVDVTIDKNKQLGAQLHNKTKDTISPMVNFQTSGFPGPGVAAAKPIVDSNTGSLLANLIGLATGQDIGSTLISLNLADGVWAMFKMLSTYLHVNVVSNPFVIASNKYKATVSLGEIRRLKTGDTTSGGSALESFGNDEAAIEVVIEPQINAEGIITIDVTVKVDEFTDRTNPNSATKTKKHVKTVAAMANKEILAIGGLIRERTANTASKVPILGDLPIIGNLFRNTTKRKIRESLLIFISPEIIEPRLGGGTNTYTENKADFARMMVKEMEKPAEQHDPVQRWYFGSRSKPADRIDEFMGKKFQAETEDISIDEYYRRRQDEEEDEERAEQEAEREAAENREQEEEQPGDTEPAEKIDVAPAKQQNTEPVAPPQARRHRRRNKKLSDLGEPNNATSIAQGAGA